MEKKRILQVEYGSFTPLVFSVNGGTGKEANKCYSRITEKIVEKPGELYCDVFWIRRKISFSMMKSIFCVFVEVDRLSTSEKNITSKNYQFTVKLDAT